MEKIYLVKLTSKDDEIYLEFIFKTYPTTHKLRNVALGALCSWPSSEHLMSDLATITIEPQNNRLAFGYFASKNWYLEVVVKDLLD